MSILLKTKNKQMNFKLNFWIWDDVDDDDRYNLEFNFYCEASLIVQDFRK